MTSKPKMNKKPGNSLQSPVGISSLKVLDDHFYLFWYKTVTW